MPASAKKILPGLLMVTSWPSRARVSDSVRAIGDKGSLRRSSGHDPCDPERAMIERARRLIADLDEWSMRHGSTRISRRALTGFLAHEGLQYAGSMAYFGVLSIFQLLVLGIVVGSYILGQGEARDFVIDQVRAGTPLDTETIAGVIDAAIESRGSMTIISFGFLLWSGLGIFSALSNGISRVFENAPPRPF